MRTLYTHALNTEQIGVREDGTTYERILVLLPEDIEEVLNQIIKEFSERQNDFDDKIDDSIALAHSRELDVVLERLEIMKEEICGRNKE